MPIKATKRNGTVRIGIKAQQVIPRPKKPSDSLRLSNCSANAVLKIRQGKASLNSANCNVFANASNACHTTCKALCSPTTACSKARKRLSHSANGKVCSAQVMQANNASNHCCKCPKTSAKLPSISLNGNTSANNCSPGNA